MNGGFNIVLMGEASIIYKYADVPSPSCSARAYGDYCNGDQRKRRGFGFAPDKQMKHVELPGDPHVESATWKIWKARWRSWNFHGMSYGITMLVN